VWSGTFSYQYSGDFGATCNFGLNTGYPYVSTDTICSYQAPHTYSTGTWCSIPTNQTACGFWDTISMVVNINPNSVVCSAINCYYGTCVCGSCYCNTTGYNTSTNCTHCYPGYYGPNCLPCPSCGFGNCSDDVLGSGNCVCNYSWSLNVTTNSCTTPLCSNLNQCNGHGQCNSYSSGSIQNCTCNTGWEEVDCSNRTCNSNEDPNNMCQCYPEYFGPNCQPCSSNCSGHGSCNDSHAGNGLCVCDPGYTSSSNCAAQSSNPIIIGAAAAVTSSVIVVVGTGIYVYYLGIARTVSLLKKCFCSRSKADRKLDAMKGMKIQTATSFNFPLEQKHNMVNLNEM